MQLVITHEGRVRAIYGEEIALDSLGSAKIFRASSVEPDRDGCWHADLRLLLGPVLGPFEQRSAAVSAEVAWLEEHWLLPRC